MFKVVGERSGGFVARVRITLQTATNNCLQIAIERWSERTQPWRWVRGSLMNHPKNIRTDDRRPASKKVKENRTQTINVCGRSKISGSTFGLLGRDVTRGATCLQRSREVTTLIEPFCQT